MGAQVAAPHTTRAGALADALETALATALAKALADGAVLALGADVIAFAVAERSRVRCGCASRLHAMRRTANTQATRTTDVDGLMGDRASSQADERDRKKLDARAEHVDRNSEGRALRMYSNRRRTWESLQNAPFYDIAFVKSGVTASELETTLDNVAKAYGAAHHRLSLSARRMVPEPA